MGVRQPYFAVIQVATANSVRGPLLHVVRSSVTLQLADSARRAAAHVRSFGYARRDDLQLLGRQEVASGRFPSPAEVESDVLWLGCRDCTDTFATERRIEAVGAAGFFGTWLDRDSGFAVLADVETGESRPLGDTRGYFCAWRRG